MSLPLCRASSIIPSVATRRSGTKVLLNLKRNTPGKSPFERPQASTPRGALQWADASGRTRHARMCTRAQQCLAECKVYMVCTCAAAHSAHLGQRLRRTSQRIGAAALVPLTSAVVLGRISACGASLRALLASPGPRRPLTQTPALIGLIDGLQHWAPLREAAQCSRPE